MQDLDNAPIWARPGGFPVKPEIGVFGFVDRGGSEQGFDSLEALQEGVVKTKSSVDAVWSPRSDYLVAPEELEELREVLRKRRRGWALGDISEGCQTPVA